MLYQFNPSRSLSQKGSVLFTQFGSGTGGFMTPVINTKGLKLINFFVTTSNASSAAVGTITFFLATRTKTGDFKLLQFQPSISAGKKSSAILSCSLYGQVPATPQLSFVNSYLFGGPTENALMRSETPPQVDGSGNQAYWSTNSSNIVADNLFVGCTVSGLSTNLLTGVDYDISAT